MKSHLQMLVASKHRSRTITFLLLFLILLLGANFTGVSDNPPGIIMLFLSISSLLLALVHPWHKVSQYLTLAGFCAAIITLMLGVIGTYAFFFFIPSNLEEFVGGFILLSVSFVCIPGIFVGLAGALYLTIKSRRKITAG